jgi:RimJ/RimL family protein N-acetyltransferase
MRNVATQRLLEKLRFRREALHLQSWAEGDRWFDEVTYARLASE